MLFGFLEIFGVTLAIINILLDTRQNVLARPLSLVGAAISLYFYYAKGLYAKVLSKCIFVMFDLYGWYQWQYGGKNQTPLPVSTTPPLQLAGLALIGLSISWILGKALAECSDAVLPYWDSLHTALAIMAYWLLMRKKLETWAVWSLANLLFVVLLYYKGIYLFSALNAFYIVLNIHGYRSWRRTCNIRPSQNS